MSDTKIPSSQSPGSAAAPAPQQPDGVPVDEREEIRELLSHYLSATQAQPGSQ